MASGRIDRCHAIPTSPTRSTSTRSWSYAGRLIRRSCRTRSSTPSRPATSPTAPLRRDGVLVANGPFDEQSDPSYRGLSIFACDVAEAARLSDGDPSVVAGRLTYDVMEWWVAAGSLAFPSAEGRVGTRRSMPD